MRTTQPKKIMIVGNAGSGKTTLAFALHQKVQLPLYHLDQYYWLPDWQRPDFEVFTKIHAELCARDTWILEGIYFKLLPVRMAHADVIIFLDTPRWLCLWRVIKRAIMYAGHVIPGNPQGCKQNLWSMKFVEFLQWVWNFNDRYRENIIQMLAQEKMRCDKKVYILQSNAQIQAFLNKRI
jgi:adenylate kinase family enzyme